MEIIAPSIWIDFMENPFRDVTITDSFALAFERHDDQFWIRALFSVRDNHPLYQEPGPEDYACYKHGWIRVAGISEEAFHWKPQMPSYDPSGEADFGSFEDVEVSQGKISCVGDWGTVTMRCESVEVSLD